MAYDVECPDGYEMVGPPYTCSASKSQFWCSEGHSGASGNCNDLVISELQQQCALVSDIATCQLPRGWRARPEDVAADEWLCPSQFEWVDDLQCLGEGDAPGSSASPLLVAGVVLGAIALVLLVAIAAVLLLGRARTA